VLGQKISKEEARRTMLTREQFIEVLQVKLCFDIGLSNLGTYYSYLKLLRIVFILIFQIHTF
jgi:hypothetical protein